MDVNNLGSLVPLVAKMIAISNRNVITIVTTFVKPMEESFVEPEFQIPANAAVKIIV